jgi:hypothetical protein
MLSGRPHVEAAVLLAAHGRPFIPLRPAGAKSMQPTHPFAFIPHDDAGGRPKPTVFPDVHHLARHIERKREGRVIELVDAEDVEVPGRPGLQTGVQIWTRIDDARDRNLGWAWLDGHGRDRLEPVLRIARQDLARAVDRRSA